MSQDYYKILGVSKNSSPDEIKKAYRNMVMKYHPDRNPNNPAAEQKFKEINNAYSVLKDPNKKSNYDRFGTTDGQGFESGGFRTGSFEDFGGFGDIFKDIFGFGSSSGSSSSKNTDLGMALEISLEDAYLGSEKIVEYTREVACEPCGGLGAASASAIKKCSACKGSGIETTQRGFLISQQTCRSCFGKGNIISKPCPSCAGSGILQQRKRLMIKIPSGCNSGHQIKIPNMGNEIRPGASGSLYVEIRITEHKDFSRKGNDLYTGCTIPMTLAALGGKIDIKFLDGRYITVVIPEGTQNNGTITVKKHGISSRGNLNIKITVTIPKQLTPKQRKLLQEFCDEES